MLDLGDIERIVGFQTHLPPCSEDSYAKLATHHARILLALRDQMQVGDRYLDFCQHASRKLGDSDVFEVAVSTQHYNRRAIELLNGVEQASPFWVDRTKGHHNGRGK